MKTPLNLRPRPTPFILACGIASLLAGTPLPVLADSFWTGTVSADWNTPGNWSAGYPGATNAIVNPNVAAFPIPTISANATTVNDIRVNDTGAGTATVNQTNGTITQTGWFRIATTAGGTGIFNMSGGTETVTGGRVYVGESGTGVMNISGTAVLNASGGDGFVLAQNAGSTGTVNQTGGTVNRTNGWFSIGGSGKGTYNISAGSLSVTGEFNVADGGASRGTLNVSGTGLVTSTGTVFVGKNTGTIGLVNVSGGTLNSNVFSVGGNAANTGSGFVTVNGASAQLKSSGEMYIGQGTGSNGLMNLSAGTVSSNDWMVVGRNASYGVLNVSGTGSARMTAGNTRFFVLGTNGGNGTLNMTGGSVEATNGGDLRLAEGGGTATANLNAGTLKVDRITDGGGTSFLYMNGGTMQARTATTTYLEGIDNAVVGAAGAIFDTNANNITVNQTLAAPTGSGVTSIPVTAGGTGHPAQPIVKITGGGGTGASAIANLTGGVVTSITITNPGIGYTSAPTVTLVDAGATTAATLGAAVVAANTTTGGLTKLSNGTLTIGSTGNSYGGATTIAGGTLSVANLSNGGAASTLGASSSAAANLVFTGGTLQYTGGSTSTDRNFTANAGQNAIFDVSNAATTLTLAGGGAATIGGLTKIGSGTLVLAGTNLYTGTTNAKGGVLAASGTYSGGFAVNSGGHLTALNLAEGTLTAPTLALGASSNVDFEFGAGATLNGVHDIITVGNASGLSLTNTGLYLYQTGGTTAFTSNGTYTLFDYTTAFTGTLSSAFTIANSQVGKLYSITNNTTATTIELSIADTVIAAWNVNGGGSWNTGTNWSPVGVPNSFGAIATFGSVLTAPNAPATVTVDGAKTVGVIVFDNANPYILSGGAADTITMDNGSGTPLIRLTNGSGIQTIAAPLALPATTNAAPFAGTTLIISGNISGAGSLSVTDTGTVVLTGTNSYASTSVTTGFLNVGDGGTTGSLGTGPVTLGTGTLLTINRSNAIAIANNISGAGSLAQTGAGTLTYSGTATHTGTTVLSAGAFISDGTITGTTSLDIENTATLRNTSSTTVAGPLVIANNATTLASLDVQNSATATVTGATTVAGGSGSWGSLNVSGSASFTTAGLTVGNNTGSGAVSVSGGTLNGGGTNIGGNSIGSLTVTGGAISTTTFHIGQNTGGDGTVNMNAGTITTNTWAVLGQGGGSTGAVNMSGGTWNQNHTDFLTVGENGMGTLSMNGTSVLNDAAAVDTSNRNTNKGNVIVGRENGGVGIWNLAGNAAARVRELRVGGNAGSDGTVNITGSAALLSPDYDLNLGYSGTGRINLNSGSVSFNQGWAFIGRNAGGTGILNINGGTFTSGQFFVGDNGTGTINLTGGLLTANGIMYLGQGATAKGTLDASGTGIVNLANGLDVGRNGLGLAKISGTAQVTITNALSLGNFGSSQGYVTQTGGTVNPAGGADWRIGGAATTNVAADITAAAAAIGIYNLSGGAFNTNHNFQIGAYGTGLMSVSGTGIATISGGFPSVGRFAGGFGVLDVSGGSFTLNSGTLLIVGEAGTGTLNVRGGTVTQNTVNTANAVSIGHTATGNGTLNLLGGTLNTLSVGSANATAISRLNFNGGTLQANGSNATFVQGLTKAYVYSGGGTVDTQTNTVTIAQNLLAPTGSGLTAIPVNAGGAGYQAAPIVKITGGGGTGATAIATLDNAGLVNAIIITNPGVDYTSAPTVTLVGGGFTTIAALAPATFAANTAGGLTKISNGTLALTGVNGFNGATINGGILNVNADAALGVSTGSVTIANGATLQAGGTLATAARTITLGTGGGQIDTNGNPVTLALGSTVTGTTLTKLGAGTLTLAGTQTYATLNANGGVTSVTNVNSALGTGTSTINANATVNINTSQTLAALNIADGVEVTFGDGMAFAGEPEIFGAAALVPEPGSLAFLMVGALGCLGRRRRSAQVR